MGAAVRILGFDRGLRHRRSTGGGSNSGLPIFFRENDVIVVRGAAVASGVRAADSFGLSLGWGAPASTLVSIPVRVVAVLL